MAREGDILDYDAPSETERVAVLEATGRIVAGFASARSSSPIAMADAAALIYRRLLAEVKQSRQAQPSGERAPIDNYARSKGLT